MPSHHSGARGRLGTQGRGHQASRLRASRVSLLPSPLMNGSLLPVYKLLIWPTKAEEMLAATTTQVTDRDEERFAQAKSSFSAYGF